MLRPTSYSLLVSCWLVACGGNTDASGGGASGGSSAAGANAAGSASGGTNGGGSTSTGGVGVAGASGGISTGGSAGASGGISAGGSAGASGGISAGGSAGGTNGGSGGYPPVDPRCPPQLPTGACTADQADALCHYDFMNGCLCYDSLPSIPLGCPHVDPKCGVLLAPPPPAPEGSAGNTAKIALPPEQACRCSAGSWQCSL